MSLALVHAKYQFLETIRIPIAVIAAAFFPAASMLFFVVPFAGGDPVGATLATASMVTFSVMMTCLFTYGVGVSEDRAQPWDPYTRTLPTGPLPRLLGRLLNGLAFTLLALIPVLVIAATLTEATITLPRLLAGVGAVLVAAVPFTLMGLAIGYWLPSKAALAVTNIMFLPLAFGGGLLANPQDLPGFIEIIAPYLPTRGAVELMWAAVAGFEPNPTALVMLGVWVVACGGLAAFAYRRDEGRRFT
jgi:ABC-2 type transport system permease protein